MRTTGSRACPISTASSSRSFPIARPPSLRSSPAAICDLEPTNVSTNLIVNRDAAPFDNADLRRAMALALDRKSFIDILFEGQADVGGALLPPPAGVWGLPP